MGVSLHLGPFAKAKPKDIVSKLYLESAQKLTRPTITLTVGERTRTRSRLQAYFRKLGFIVLLIVFVLCLRGAPSNAQDKPQDKSPKPIPSPSPQRLGTELDGPVIVNTDLITLTVTVTDTYGRYVSGLSKNAFTIQPASSNRRLSVLQNCAGRSF
jgi:hypothetical protein